jgi:hypothetical protein
MFLRVHVRPAPHPQAAGVRLEVGSAATSSLLLLPTVVVLLVLPHLVWSLAAPATY